MVNNNYITHNDLDYAIKCLIIPKLENFLPSIPSINNVLLKELS